MSNPSPTITFVVNLDNARHEAFGPNTNSSSTGVLHPDRHQTNQDSAIAAEAVHKNQRSSFLPGFLAGENIVRNDDGTITAYGMKAYYLQKTYTVGLNPLLTVVS
mgnify:CR=1 FL=1